MPPHSLELWHAVVLGLVEGITEYLPISSTGHLILASALMKLDDPHRKEAIDAFMIVIQGGAILAVLGLYWPSVVRMLKGLAGKDAKGLRLLINLFVAFLPAAVIGLALDKIIEAKLFHAGPVLGALIVGGLFMIILDRWREGRLSSPKFHTTETTDVFDVTVKQAFFIGCMQVFAMWPGTSRSMMTIAGGVMAGLRPKQAAEFSFLLGLPTLGAATLYKLAKNLKHAHDTGGENMFQQLGVTPVLVGIIVAAISAAIAVKWLVGFLNKHGLSPFGWYRIALAIVLFVLLSQGVVSITK